MDEPALTFFRRDYAPPEPFPVSWPGAWRSEPSFPPPGATETSLWLAAGDVPLAGRLAGEALPDGGVDRFPHRATTGTRTALSWGAGQSAERPGSRPPASTTRSSRPTRARRWPSRSRSSASPLADLAIEASMPVATVVVRLSDVAPDGTAAQVAAGVLNLTHRDSHACPDATRARPASTQVRVADARSRLPVRAGSPDPAVGRDRTTGRCSGRRRSAASWRSTSAGRRLILPTIPPGDGSLSTPAFKTDSGRARGGRRRVVRAARLADPGGRHRRHRHRLDQRRRRDHARPTARPCSPASGSR